MITRHRTDQNTLTGLFSHCDGNIFFSSSSKHKDMLVMSLLGLAVADLSEKSSVSMFCDMTSVYVKTSKCAHLSDRETCENSYEMRCSEDDPACSSRRCRYSDEQVCTLDSRPGGCLCLTLEPSFWASEGVCIVQDGDCASAPRTNNLVSAVSLHPHVNYGHIQPWADSGCTTNGAFFHVCDGAGHEIQNAMAFISSNDTLQPWLSVDWLKQCPPANDTCDYLRTEYARNTCCSTSGRRLHAPARLDVPYDAIPASNCAYFYSLNDDRLVRCSFALPHSCETIELPYGIETIKLAGGSCSEPYALANHKLWRYIRSHWSYVYLSEVPIDIVKHDEKLYGVFFDGIHEILDSGSTSLRVEFGKLHITDSVFGKSKFDTFVPQSANACGKNVFVLMQSRPEERVSYVLRVPDINPQNTSHAMHEVAFKMTGENMHRGRLACIDDSIQIVGVENAYIYE